MKHTILGAVVAVSLPFATWAENLAVVVANSTYDSLSGPRISAAVDEAVRAFGEAGFEVVVIRDARFAGAASELSAARARIEAADRLAVLLAGNFAHDGRQTWLLTRDARAPDAFTVGAQAVPVGALLELAGAVPGASAVLLADETGRLRLGPGLTAGAAPVAPPQGVAVFTGSMRGILSTIRGGLLEPGQSLAEVAADLPSGVAASGFLSGAVSFRPEAGARPAPVAQRPEPPAQAPVQALDPEGAEAALGLTRDARRSVQRDLELLGYDPRGIDGIFGRGTRAAIAAWQDANGAPATGFLTGNQVARLQEQGAQRSAELEAEAARRQAEEDRRDTAFWQETGAGGGEQGLRAYLERYPDGLYADRARAALEPYEADRRAQAAAADRAVWDTVRLEDTVQGYRGYLEQFPQGAFRREAEARIAQLQGAGTDDRAVAAARAEEAGVAGSVVARLLIEQRLRQVGEDPGAIDGTFDEAARRAIRRFQRARDLPVTGYVSQATLARLLAP
jgi:peptidoglycan hydrolase-like protein with peptidoglycan-binding domain